MTTISDNCILAAEIFKFTRTNLKAIKDISEAKDPSPARQFAFDLTQFERKYRGRQNRLRGDGPQARGDTQSTESFNRESGADAAMLIFEATLHFNDIKNIPAFNDFFEAPIDSSEIIRHAALKFIYARIHTALPKNASFRIHSANGEISFEFRNGELKNITEIDLPSLNTQPGTIGEAIGKIFAFAGETRKAYEKILTDPSMFPSKEQLREHEIAKAMTAFATAMRVIDKGQREILLANPDALTKIIKETPYSRF